MRIASPYLPPQSSPAFVTTLQTLLGQIVSQLNALGDGSVYAIHSAGTAAPTGGTWNVGDFVANSSPSEAGTAGSKYVVMGWKCTVAGTPGTWLACRALTGN